MSYRPGENEKMPFEEMTLLSARFKAFLFDLFLVFVLIALPFLFGKIPLALVISQTLSFLLFAFTLYWAYHFLFLFFLGVTPGDSLLGIYLSYQRMGFLEALIYALLKAFFSFTLINVLAIFLDRKDRTAEQILYGVEYLKH